MKNEIVDYINNSFEGNYFKVNFTEQKIYALIPTYKGSPVAIELVIELIYIPSDEVLIRNTYVLPYSRIIELDWRTREVVNEFNKSIITNLIFGKETNNKVIDLRGDTVHTFANIKKEILCQKK